METDEAEYFKEQGIICNKVIASGAYGIVYMVYHNAYKSTFALKRVPKASFNESELECLKAIDNPHIVSLYKTYKFNGNCYMLMEYCPNSLSNMIKEGTSMNPIDLYKYAYDILLSLKACHDCNIAHCDIKPTNFLIDRYGRLKISDFGLSGCFSKNQKTNVFQGTKLFMAPEIFSAAEYDPMKADIWAIGVTLYLMATGNYPFYAQDYNSLAHLIGKGLYSNELVEDVLLANVISSCLDLIPANRPTVDQILAMPYFNQDIDMQTNKIEKEISGNLNKSLQCFICRPKVMKRVAKLSFFTPSPLRERLHLSRPISRSVERFK